MITRLFEVHNRAFIDLVRRIVVLSALPLTACGSVPESDEPPVTSQTAPLYLTGHKWPNGLVPVCWDAQATQRSDFPRYSRWVRDIVNLSWPVVANIEFTGWGTCPADSTGMTRVVLADTGLTRAQVGAGGKPWVHLNLSAIAPRLFEVVVVHEFGHILGFHHEMIRPGFPEASCDDTDAPGGNTLNTAYDYLSVMASTYCNENAKLTLWDVVGVRNAYGPRAEFASPLVTGWNGARGDHATVATKAGLDAMSLSGYNPAYAEGWVFNTQLHGTVPLKLFWHAARGDNFSTATAAGEQAALAAGYTFVRVEGYAFSADQGAATVPLKLYWHAGREDNMLTATAAGEQAAVAAGYAYVRDEGYIPNETPYSLLWKYFSTARSDSLSTVPRSATDSLLVNAHNAGYTFVGFEAAVPAFPFTGTVPIEQYYHDGRGDHFLLGNVLSAFTAVNAGYRFVRSEGFAYPLNIGSLTPLKSFWVADGKDDHLTAVVAPGGGYTLVRTEGLGFSIVP